jgi:hypothetical protein
MNAPTAFTHDDHEATKLTTRIPQKSFVGIERFRLRQGYGETSPKLEERRRVVRIVMRSWGRDRC